MDEDKAWVSVVVWEEREEDPGLLAGVTQEEEEVRWGWGRAPEVPDCFEPALAGAHVEGEVS